MAELDGISHGESTNTALPFPVALVSATLPQHPVRFRSLISQPGERNLLLLPRQDPVLGLQTATGQPTCHEAHLIISQDGNYELVMAPSASSHQNQPVQP